ncbi:autotransporter outer membrane beta-barrel domain-containing protein, partial [Stenotrophomonas sepilia]
GSRNGFDAVSRQLDIRGNSQALTVGADLWRHDSGSSVGVMLSTGNASSTSTNELTGYYARGKVKGEALGIYGTWRGGNGADPYAGFYVDGSVQRAQFRNRVEGIGLDAERYDSRAWQGAVETGYAFRVGGASNGG